MTVAVYPGSFDPIHNGHLDVIERALGVFERLVVGVLENPRKQARFSATDRIDLIRRALAAADPARAARVEVTAFDGLTVDFCGSVGAPFIVRGLRAISDFETEMLLAHNNRRLAPKVDTVFFMTSIEHSYVASSLVKEIAAFGGDVSGMVPPVAAAALTGLLRSS
jgi:pantetheine-phosphate adenylyltransferase